MHEHELRDQVLSQRIYGEFIEAQKSGGLGGGGGGRDGGGNAARFDFRMFLLALCCMASEPLETKIPLVFKLYDSDGSGTLSMLEMMQIATIAAALHGHPANRQQAIVEHISRVWEEIQRLHYEKAREARQAAEERRKAERERALGGGGGGADRDRDRDRDRAGGAANPGGHQGGIAVFRGGVRCEDLLQHIAASELVRGFFEEALCDLNTPSTAKKAYHGTSDAHHGTSDAHHGTSDAHHGTSDAHQQAAPATAQARPSTAPAAHHTPAPRRATVGSAVHAATRSLGGSGGGGGGGGMSVETPATQTTLQSSSSSSRSAGSLLAARSVASHSQPHLLRGGKEG